MSRRTKLRQEMLADIKSTARRQMAENGTAGVSLSAIARELEVSQPALYRYYASRDDLVTALIVDAFNDLADSIERADRQTPVDAYSERLMKTIQAYRDWALENPVDFQLIYGNPIPGYKAPFEVTAPASRRSFTVILTILAEAYEAGALKPQPEHVRAAETLPISLPTFEHGQPANLPPLILYLGVMGWYRIHGMIMLELFHHTQSIIPDGDAFYDHEIGLLLKSIGLVT